MSSFKYEADVYRYAKENGFKDYYQYKEAKEKGFTNAKNFEEAKKLDIHSYTEYNLYKRS